MSGHRNEKAAIKLENTIQKLKDAQLKVNLAFDNTEESYAPSITELVEIAEKLVKEFAIHETETYHLSELKVAIHEQDTIARSILYYQKLIPKAVKPVFGVLEAQRKLMKVKALKPKK